MWLDASTVHRDDDGGRMDVSSLRSAWEAWMIAAAIRRTAWRRVTSLVQV
jgi:hypothetical protein